MASLIVPKERNYGWELKPISSAHFKVTRNLSNQICIVLAHSLLRGVTSEMIHWWFCNFPNLKVRLVDIPGYENQVVPAYLLWHPSDHVSARLSGKLGPGNTPQVGAKIHIQEYMQYLKYQRTYEVDQALTVFYHEKNGWGMGKKIPVFGNLMALRISFKDVFREGQIIGVQYHYEVAAGAWQQNFIAKWISKKITGQFDDQFWNAWLTHNVIEVGVFENFLPPLYEQRHQLDQLRYARNMNPIQESPKDLKGFSQGFFEERVKGFENSKNGFDFQQTIGQALFKT